METNYKPDEKFNKDDSFYKTKTSLMSQGSARVQRLEVEPSSTGDEKSFDERHFTGTERRLSPEGSAENSDAKDRTAKSNQAAASHIPDHLESGNKGTVKDDVKNADESIGDTKGAAAAVQEKSEHRNAIPGEHSTVSHNPRLKQDETDGARTTYHTMDDMEKSNLKMEREPSKRSIREISQTDTFTNTPQPERSGLSTMRTPPEGLDKHSEDQYPNEPENLYFTGRLPTLLPREPSEEKTGEIARESFKSGANVPMEKSDHLVKEPHPETSPVASYNRIHGLRDEITAKPDKVPFTLTKEKPLTPNTPFQRERSDFTAIQAVAEENEIELAKEANSNVNMNVGDIQAVTSKVVGTTYSKDYQAHFENMAHFKNIDTYVEANDLKDKPVERIKEKYEKKTKNESDTKENKDNKAQLPRTPKSSENHREDKHISSEKRTLTDIPIDKSTIEKIEQLPKVERVSTEDGQKFVNSSENDEQALKDIIASAKKVYDQNVNAPSMEVEITQDSVDLSGTITEMPTGDTSGMSVKGGLVVQIDRKSRYGPDFMGSDVLKQSSLICSSCLQPDSNVHSSGFCKVCQKYLCNTCITLHTMDNTTSTHEILACYCKNELAVNKHVKATAYCMDCTHFLCSKCALDHVGKRIFKRHRIIQSLFYTKFFDRKSVSSRQFLGGATAVDIEGSQISSVSKRKKLKQIVHHDENNPYRVALKTILPTLYPGPKKNLAVTYVTNPKWPRSSVASLPYLVQPKPIGERMLESPYLEQHQPMGYAGKKQILDTLHENRKLKTLRTRYGVKEDAKTYSLKGHPTARAIQRLNDVEITRIIKSRSSYRRTSADVQIVTTAKIETELKALELVKEQCLAIPFPSGEKNVIIQKIITLLNGKLLVLDKNNNNIKLYGRMFRCKAALQFHNRIVDITASNLCPTDLYAATPRHIYEISGNKGLSLTKKYNVDMRRIEGLVCWKYGLAIISKFTDVTWELRLMDYRGNLKFKLEVLNPFTSEIANNSLYHVCATRNGKYLSISDTKNGCVITVDLVGLKVAHESNMPADKPETEDDVLKIPATPKSLTSDDHDNVFVSCGSSVVQINRRGDVIGANLASPPTGKVFGSVAFSKMKGKDRLYVQVSDDTINVYRFV
ncbi:hypothetical protein DPMN_076859 [Dreissena polymorpha]|uniref:B box-type domain-containing protein n=1 Tax=Dreissena polymorpha TaxID=45954 RepID=A0A9D3YPG1_DREPO|nr:hypothetical protein DPMN_076859 [Dreissena polymorpha]